MQTKSYVALNERYEMAVAGVWLSFFVTYFGAVSAQGLRGVPLTSHQRSCMGICLTNAYLANANALMALALERKNNGKGVE